MSSAVAEHTKPSQNAPPVCLFENPYGLVSLWDMVSAYAQHFATLTSMLVSFDKISTFQFERDPLGNWRPHDQAFIDGVFEILRKSVGLLEELKLTQSSIYAGRLLKKWGNLGFESVSRDHMLEILHERIMDELGSTFFIHLSPEKAALYRHPTRGWEEITSRFQESQTDIEEMNRVPRSIPLPGSNISLCQRYRRRTA